MQLFVKVIDHLYLASINAITDNNIIDNNIDLIINVCQYKNKYQGVVPNIQISLHDDVYQNLTDILTEPINQVSVKYQQRHPLNNSELNILTLINNMISEKKKYCNTLFLWNK